MFLLIMDLRRDEEFMDNVIVGCADVLLFERNPLFLVWHFNTFKDKILVDQD